MTEISCPSCGHAFDAPRADAATPDPSVVRWFRTDPGWLGEASTDEVYLSYLRATEVPPVTRSRFVATLGLLGIDEVLDDDTYLLVRT